MSQQVNLYQAGFRKQQQRFSSAVMVRTAAALAVGVVAMYGLFAWQTARQREVLREIEAQQASLSRQIAEVGRKVAPRDKSKQLEEEIARAERELVTLGKVQELLQQGVFANTRGYSQHFVSLARQHVAGLWLTGFDIAGAGERMRLQGRAVDPALVPRYMQRLAAEQPLAGTEFEVFQMSRPEKDKATKKSPTYVEFLIQTAGKSAPAEAPRP